MIYGTFGSSGGKILKAPVGIHRDNQVTLESRKLVHGCGAIGLLDGHIYNNHKLYQDTKNATSPEDAFVHILEENAPKKAMEKFDGGYAIAFWDKKRLVLLRDPIGIRPLFYTKEPFTFASERKLLGGEGKAVEPGEALIVEGGKILTSRKYDPFKVPKAKITLERAAVKLRKLLEKSVQKRVDEKTAIAFSGGLDSTIIAQIAKQYCEPKLFVVGLAHSHDPFTAIKVAKKLELGLHRVAITEKELPILVKKTTDAIERTDYMQTQIGVPFYALFKRIKTKGYQVVLAGQGADELFAGYARHQRFARDGKLERALEKDFREIGSANLERDSMLASAQEIDLRLPYLDQDVAKFARSLPVKFKATASRRKIVLREVARQLDLPEEVVNMPKKAIQYGTGISKVLK